MPFLLAEFSIRKITTHHFHVDDEKGYTYIGYDMIIGYNLMVNLELISNVKSKVLELDNAVVTI